MNGHLLKVEGLEAAYGASRILYGVSLTVEPGEVSCLLGRNGVGKTTTLKSIMGLLKPAAGSVALDGTDVTGWAPHRVARMGVGYVPEERRIFPTLTVLENLEMGNRESARTALRGGMEWSVDAVLDYFPGLKRRAGSMGRFLSGGEQQMLSIGRALVTKPRVLLVDEPTEGLAPVIVEVVEKVIRDVAAQGVAVLLVESKLAVAERLANRVYVISKGTIVYEGKANDLKQREDIRKQYLEV